MKAATTARRPTGYQRRNFSLRPDTARLLDRLPPEVNRSGLVDTAIQRLVKDRGRAQLRKLIAEEAADNAARDLRLAEEWFAVDAEGWPSNDHEQNPRVAVTSISWPLAQLSPPRFRRRGPPS